MNHLSKINNKELLETFSSLVLKERTTTSEVVSYIAELYKRRLYLELGYPSLFVMLTEKYFYSKSAAYRRIQSAKVALLFPIVLEYLNQGRTNLINLSLVESNITKENGEKIISDILDKSKEEVEYYLDNTFSNSKEERTQDKIRRLPVIKKESKNSHSGNLNLNEEREKKTERSLEIFQPFSLPSTEAQSPVTETKEEPKVEEIRRVKIEFTADEKLAKKIERAQQLLRHKYPAGKFEDIFDEALETLLEKKDPERKIARMEQKETKEVKTEPKSTPQTVSRYIPQQIRREIWKRDNGRCTFQSKEGKKCNEAGMLEIDHVHPFALDGKNKVENLQLLCAPHNKWRAQKTFGIFST